MAGIYNSPGELLSRLPETTLGSWHNLCIDALHLLVFSEGVGVKMGKQTKIILIFIIALFVVRLSAPVMVEYYFNEHRLANLGDYAGEVADVDLALWRGAYRLKGLQVYKASEPARVDLLQVPVVDISLSWRSLLKGSIRAELHVERPTLNFVDGETASEQQSGSGIEWDPDGIVDFVFEKITIRGGTLAFRNFTSKPPVNLQATNIDITATNLTNVADAQGQRVANLEISANIFDDSKFSAKAEFDPFQYTSFLFASKLVLDDLTNINDFARAYGNLDFESGGGEMVMELHAEDSMLYGYAKPAFEDMVIFEWEQDVKNQDTNALQVLWEAIAEGISSLFTNQRTDTLATRINISGELPDGAVLDRWSAVWGIISNAFVQSVNTNFEHITPLTDDVEEEVEE